MQRLVIYVLAIVGVTLNCVVERAFAVTDNGNSRARDVDRNTPRNVMVDVFNETSIQLRWEVPRDAGTNRCPIQSYTIRMKTDGATRSRTLKVDGARNSVALNDLVTGSAYQVRLVAVDCEGKGKPSRWLRVRTTNRSSSNNKEKNAKELVIPGKPTYVRTRTFPDSVIVSWLPPEDDVTVRGYMIGYGEGVPDVNWQYVEAARTNVTIRNLKSATRYIVSLRAFNNAGKGPVVYDLIYTRELSATTVGPSSAPTELRAKVISPTTVWLQWADPSLGRVQQLTDNRYYNVHYHPTSPSVGKTLSVIVKAFHVVLHDLTPGTRYEFKVRMVKDSQASPFSEIIANKTFDTVPSSPPRSIVVKATNVSGSVIVTWRPPRQPNGDITGYLVLYIDEPDQPTDKWRVQSVPGQDLSTTVTDLAPNRTYHFKVQCRNSLGYSPMSSSVIYYTKFQHNPGRPNISSSVTTPSSIDSGKTVVSDDKTKLDTRYNGNGVESQRWENENKTNTSTEYEEEDEEDDDEYVGGDDVELDSEALVPEESSSRRSVDGKTKREPPGVDRTPSSRSQEPTDLDGPARAPPSAAFRSVVHYQVTAYVTWPGTLAKCERRRGRRADGDNSLPVSGYLFRFAKQKTDQLERFVIRNLTNNFVLLDNLVPDTTYRYQVKYLFVGGIQSSWSGESSFDTHYQSK